MLTRDEVKRLCIWISETDRKWGCDGVDETWGEYFTRGLRELGLIEHEPTAKEKVLGYVSDLESRYNMIRWDVVHLELAIDEAIKEAEERK